MNLSYLDNEESLSKSCNPLGARKPIKRLSLCVWPNVFCLSEPKMYYSTKFNHNEITFHFICMEVITIIWEIKITFVGEWRKKDNKENPTRNTMKENRSFFNGMPACKARTSVKYFGRLKISKGFDSNNLLIRIIW